MKFTTQNYNELKNGLRWHDPLGEIDGEMIDEFIK